MSTDAWAEPPGRVVRSHWSHSSRERHASLSGCASWFAARYRRTPPVAIVATRRPRHTIAAPAASPEIRHGPAASVLIHSSQWGSRCRIVARSCRERARPASGRSRPLDAHTTKGDGLLASGPSAGTEHRLAATPGSRRSCLGVTLPPLVARVCLPDCSRGPRPRLPRSRSAATAASDDVRCGGHPDKLVFNNQRRRYVLTPTEENT